MQKFIHDKEQYVLEVKKKHGKTKIDKELINYRNLKLIKDTHIYIYLINYIINLLDNKYLSFIIIINLVFINCFIYFIILFFQYNLY